MHTYVCIYIYIYNTTISTYSIVYYRQVIEERVKLGSAFADKDGAAEEKQEAPLTRSSRVSPDFYRSFRVSPAIQKDVHVGQDAASVSDNLKHPAAKTSKTANTSKMSNLGHPAAKTNKTNKIGLRP